MPENSVDIAILFVLSVYALHGLRRGFLLGTLELAGFVLAVVVALRTYPLGVEQIQPFVPLPTAYLKPIAFLGIWLLADLVIALVLRVVGAPLAFLGGLSSVNSLLGLVPGALKGAVIVALLLALALVLPLPEPVKAALTDSALAGRLAGQVPALERILQDVFGDAVLDGIAFTTIRPQADERVALKFTVPDAPIDPEAETRLLQLVNAERERVGLAPLAPDPALTTAARAHARDMLAQGYFAHLSPDGKTPADRARAAGARLQLAGENLALAPTVDLAHRGLMDSPGHRANILSPQFSRVGIGVADGGLHGKLFTQEFAD